MKYDPELEAVLWRCAVWLALLIAFFLVGCVAGKALTDSPEPAPRFQSGFTMPLPAPPTTSEPAGLLFPANYNPPEFTPDP